MLWAKLPEFKFELCVLENSISVLYQFPLLTHGVDERISLACNESPINIMINIIQPCTSLPRTNFPHCTPARLPGETIVSSLETRTTFSFSLQIHSHFSK